MGRGSRVVVFLIAAVVVTMLLAAVVTGCGESLPDGTHFGFVHEVSGGELLFDPAEYLTGDAAAAAYRAHGEEPVEPHYLDNPKVEEIRLQVDPEARFSLVAYDSTGAPALEQVLSYDELAALWTAGEDEPRPSPLLGLVIVVLLGKRPVARTIVAVVVGVMTLLLWVPVCWLLYVALGLSLLPLIMAIVAILMTFLVAVLWKQEPGVSTAATRAAR